MPDLDVPNAAPTATMRRRRRRPERRGEKEEGQAGAGVGQEVSGKHCEQRLRGETGAYWRGPSMDGLRSNSV